MEAIMKILSVFGAVFLLLTLVLNFLVKRFPHIPGDIDIQRPGLTIYIPFASAIALTIILVIIFNYFFRY